ncbi:hypothetical protein [Brevibacillus laterosporus]|uniref:Uncharacterized protein n=1 Tax=Brevibacillus laterosporus TaxID=1465 RepID=A0AAP3DGE0_BRELA|nr:hypothetical protein [Brevibacillus laterosporus]MBM7107223.1 hypothetical protein [Brevibacillus laterosporus]MCR8936624.1 hypothetical protein [Brevibacillus laterosporus]MCR8980022.1 hypothetical protein [Brevibacillus laterosporus]MCZ0807177.1 hypothetical protein [Brevibacillus laterosporus]MCZ0825426.1 hypothetical protein [Brevibacillus laterosporus]
MITYIFLAIALVLLGYRFTQLWLFKRKSKTEAEMDQYLHALLNNEGEQK